MPPAAVSEFPEDPTKAGATGVIGHYTQIVWAETSEVGCGYIRFTDVEGTVTDVSNKKQILNYFATYLKPKKNNSSNISLLSILRSWCVTMVQVEIIMKCPSMTRESQHLNALTGLQLPTKNFVARTTEIIFHSFKIIMIII